MDLQRLFQELKRRNVFRVATAYAIAGWLIIQVVATTAPQLGFPEWVPPFITVLVLVGFPLALIFAWAFELTPEGIKKSKEVDITESVTSRTGKKLNGIIITVLSMAVIFLLVERVFFAEAAFIENQTGLNIETASIAVLPFVNMSGDADNEYFSDGLSEELLNGLAKLEDMQVAGRTSSFQFKGTNPDLRDVGAQLGVKHILEGSVRKSGNRVRITAQLIQADNGFHLWSETYDRELTASDIFDIQEEITRMVVQELKVKLLPQEEVQIAERPTQDIEAYNAFLEATQLEITRAPNDIAKAIEKYQEAIRIDPTFALAYARLAFAYGLDFGYGYDSSGEKRERIKKLMRDNIDHALLLDSNLGQAYHALGFYYSLTDEHEKSEQAYKKALETLPHDAFVLNGYFLSLRDNGKPEEGYKVLEQAYKTDMLNPVVARNYANYLIDVKREFDEGVAIFDQIIERYPDYMPIKVEKAWVMRDIPYGRPDEAFRYMYEAYKDNPTDLQYMQYLGQIAGDVELFEYSEYLAEKIERLYPNVPFSAFPIRTPLYFYNQDFEGLEDYSRNLVQNFDQVTEQDIRFPMMVVHFGNGQYDLALDIMQELQPVLFEDTLVLENQNAIMFQLYFDLLLKTGDTRRAEYMAEVFCSNVPETATDLEEGRDIAWLYEDRITCSIFSGEYSEALKRLEEFFFVHKSKANWPASLKGARIYRLLSNEPGYDELVDRMLADLHRMRKPIIDLLKTEGEWKEEWNVEE